jgi:hypothetical protein
MASRSRYIAASLVALLALPMLAATPDSDKDAEKTASDPLEELLEDAEDCISLRRIQRSEVIDEQTIVFHLSGGQVYVNRLPRRCPGLRHNKAIMYKTSLSKLCRLDMITVLDSMGFGFQRGASCGLGSFVPVSEETVELLRESDE